MSTAVIVALITTSGTILAAVIGVLVQNQRQHGQAAGERAKDRQVSDEYRTQLSAAIDQLHTDVVQVRDVVVEHITDRSLHGG